MVDHNEEPLISALSFFTTPFWLLIPKSPVVQKGGKGGVMEEDEVFR